MSIMPAFVAHAKYDVPQYVILRDWGHLGRESVSDPQMTRAQIVRDIAEGQIDRVVSVTEYNAVEGYSSDITDEIRGEVYEKRLASNPTSEALADLREWQAQRRERMFVAVPEPLRSGLRDFLNVSELVDQITEGRPVCGND